MQVKRWLVAGTAVLSVVLIGGLGAISAPDAAESCGLGPPPGTPGFAEAEARRKAEMQQNGFLRVCDANLDRWAIAFKPLPAAANGLAFQPVDLSHTPFARFEPLGGLAEAVDRTKSRYYRGFRLPGGQTLTLFEHDMSADGSTSWHDSTDWTERVNGQEAHLAVLQSGSRAASVLSWGEGRRNYQLWVNANVARQPLREELLALAASLPPSVPACPKEPAPKPIRVGPNGLPIFEPPPAVLTMEQMEALDKPRPCK